MKLISWNVNGLRAAWKKGLADFLSAERPDVLCVQETKIQEDHLTDEMRSPDGYRSYWCFAEKKGYSGVATYTREEPIAVGVKCGSPTLDSEGRIVHTELADFHLFNVYFPNSGMGPERLAHKLRAERRINRLENIAVRQAVVTEGWQEKGQDFVTLYFLASLLDYTTDESGAQVLDGSRTEPVKFEEYWTFTRPVGPNPWKLSAIQQSA